MGGGGWVYGINDYPVAITGKENRWLRIVAGFTLVVEEAADLEVGQGREDSLAARIRDTWMAYWRTVCRPELLTMGWERP